MKCADVFFVDFRICDDIMEEDCIMNTDLEADFSHGASNFTPKTMLSQVWMANPAVPVIASHLQQGPALV